MVHISGEKGQDRKLAVRSANSCCSPPLVLSDGLRYVNNHVIHERIDYSVNAHEILRYQEDTTETRVIPGGWKS